MRRTAIAGGLAGVVLLSGMVLLRAQNRGPAPGPAAEAKKEPHASGLAGHQR
ncbi:MAG TPA: hypothetical protein VG013_30320 [Gemmataceae bacterium]|nr:hypothetical protein [Gemmataceae bacterium]